MWSLRSAAVVLSLLAVLALLQENAVAQEATGAKTDDTKVRQLQLKRLATLERAVAVVERQYQEGATDFSRVHQLQTDWLIAAIDQASSPKERIDLLTKQLAVARAAWQIAEAQFDGGRVSELDVLQARSVTLQVEIELAKAHNGMAANNEVSPVREEPDATTPRCPPVRCHPLRAAAKRRMGGGVRR